MKIDRLLGITIYLLNRKKVSTQMLAQKFEVSSRTIQRDIEALNMAGIPVVSVYGKNGGYQIPDDYKINNQITTDMDYSFILTALKGLATAYENPKIDNTLEKLISVSRNNDVQNVFLDFSVLHEGNNINTYLRLIDNAISEKKALEIDYTNAESVLSHRIVEPIALIYKWYSWYMLCYCTEKHDYRLFKLIRISKLKKTDRPFTTDHEKADVLIKKQDALDNRKYIDFRLLCKAEVKMQSVEFLCGTVEKEFENGDFILKLHLPESEQMWFWAILGLGNKVRVLDSDCMKEKLKEKAKEILEMY